MPMAAQSSLSHWSTDAVLHPPPLQWHHLPQRAVGDDHPPGVDPEMAGEAVEPLAHVVDQLGGEPRG